MIRELRYGQPYAIRAQTEEIEISRENVLAE
jgi:hypothetical protein